MDNSESDYSFSDGYKSALTNNSNELRRLAEKLAYVYINNPKSRMNFLRDINEFITRNELEVKNYCLSLSAGMDNITEARDKLELQHNLLRSNQVMQYAIAEVKYNEKNNVKTILLKEVGYFGGGLQILAGFGSCSVSAGALYASFGAALIAQGTNNVYENGYYLLYREDNTGYLRDGYRFLSNELGYGNKEADIAYASIDLFLSGYSMLKPTIKPDGWKLFYYKEDSLIQSWQNMGKIGLGTEIFFDVFTIYTTYDAIKEHERKVNK
ncbi:DUF4225 domain-containing protein [Providencia sneebia]|uniref:DUF4225 domain-containing protein n=1 Tax=Providencia sneebia DSM 19967 TaxID=1141660 RepID=K8WJS5_9GAMM|nr:hypothetical protein OO7_02086 [Providencia sneebia DSM 19967]